MNSKRQVLFDAVVANNNERTSAAIEVANYSIVGIGINVTGTGITLSVQAQRSNDGTNFENVGSAVTFNATGYKCVQIDAAGFDFYRIVATETGAANATITAVARAKAH